MKKEKVNVGKTVSRGGRAVADVLDKAKRTVVSVADQNDDGKLDLQDVSVMAEAIGDTARKTAIEIKKSVDIRAYEQERKTLNPIFEDDLLRTDFLMSKLVRITEMDKKHAESKACIGSIGYMSIQKDLKIVNIYRDKADSFGLTFYPDMDGEIYYVDPFDRNRYIALDDYFGHLKVVRINELQKIAQDLGATHFKVTYKEQQVTQTAKRGKGTGKAQALTAKASTTAEVQQEVSTSAFTSVEIAAEMTCPGHTPVRPKLVYLQRDPSIQSLITLRMDAESPITHQKYTLRLSNSSGIKESDAIKIDAALKLMKCSSHANVTMEVRKEAKRFFEYEIDF